MPRLLLIRHARAGARGLGPDDLERPLDERGLAQAAALPALLAPHLSGAPGVATEVRSSPARRCVQTVTPLAATLHTTVTLDAGLVEGADVAALHLRLATLEGMHVWSSHGDVIPELLLMLARRGLDLGEDPSCRKGSTWIIDVTGGEVVRAQHLPPP